MGGAVQGLGAELVEEALAGAAEVEVDLRPAVLVHVVAGDAPAGDETRADRRSARFDSVLTSTRARTEWAVRLPSAETASTR